MQLLKALKSTGEGSFDYSKADTLKILFFFKMLLELNLVILLHTNMAAFWNLNSTCRLVWFRWGYCMRPHRPLLYTELQVLDLLEIGLQGDIVMLVGIGAMSPWHHVEATSSCQRHCTVRIYFWGKLYSKTGFKPLLYPKHRALLHNVPSMMMSFPCDTIVLGTSYCNVTVGGGAFPNWGIPHPYLEIGTPN